MSDRIAVVGNKLFFLDNVYRCAVGKCGFSDHKKEGDGCTPLGVFSLRECWYRADRMDAPETGLPLRAIKENDGWCDDPASADYNKHIKILPLPLAGEGRGGGKPLALNVGTAPLPNPPPLCGRGDCFENLWREDHVYDLIVPIGYNDDPVTAGKGSAIFMHLAHADYRPTEGCVALAREDLLAVLKLCAYGTVIDISKG